MTARNADTLRVATLDDAAAIAELVNAAFGIEAFFKVGDRTDIDEIRRHLASGEFLIIDADSADESGPQMAGCVYLERNGAHAYFGMLSIDPARQRQGIGRLLIKGLEDRCRAFGCTAIEIHVVNLREELPPIYRRLGYEITGTLPFPDDGTTTRECHFIVMRKAL